MAEQTAYEQALESRVGGEFYHNVLEQKAKEQEQKELLAKLFEGYIAGLPGLTDEEKKIKLQECISNPSLYIPEIQQHEKKLHEEAKEGKNLEAIINSAPLEVLARTLQYINTKEPTDAQMGLYTEVMNIHPIYKKATQERDGETLKKLEGNIRKVVAQNILSPEYSDHSNKETFEFLQRFVKVMSQGYVMESYNRLAEKASEFITDEKNDGKVRNYVKDIVTKDEKQRMRFYQTAFAQTA